jgi:hypothetical protein
MTNANQQSTNAGKNMMKGEIIISLEVQASFIIVISWEAQIPPASLSLLVWRLDSSLIIISLEARIPRVPLVLFVWRLKLSIIRHAQRLHMNYIITALPCAQGMFSLVG